MLHDKKRKKCNVTAWGKSFNIEYNSFGKGLVMTSLTVRSHDKNLFKLLERACKVNLLLDSMTTKLKKPEVKFMVT